MFLLAALALFLAPTLPAQALSAPETGPATQVQDALASDDPDQKCIIIMGHIVCL
ncbi:hypothetical protein [Rubrivirga sp. SAORIC476]|uniref:hypothetical protein n=1 Tax=Rubrivirga sp. SAORIC476 TaxID=1961794 RepID=UPI0013042A0F|nr:hypothetical protein [Rubrivirga sp. SAORIC476]